MVVGDAEELKGITTKKITWRKDLSKMTRIPAGSFEIGNAKDWMKSARPVHTVELNAFYMHMKRGDRRSIQVVFSRDRTLSIT